MTDDEQAIRSWWDQARKPRALSSLPTSIRPDRRPRIRLESSLFFLLSFTFNDDLARLISSSRLPDEFPTAMLWHVRIQPSPEHPDRLGERLAAEAVESGLAGPWSVESSRGFLIEGAIPREELERVARDVLVDPVVEVYKISPSNTPSNGSGAIVHVMPKPGVTDPEGSSALELLRVLGFEVSNVRTIRTYRIQGPEDSLERFIDRVLANDAVEMTVRGTLTLDRLDPGQTYRFRRVSVPIRDLTMPSCCT